MFSLALTRYPKHTLFDADVIEELDPSSIEVDEFFGRRKYETFQKAKEAALCSAMYLIQVLERTDKDYTIYSEWFNEDATLRVFGRKGDEQYIFVVYRVELVQ